MAKKGLIKGFLSSETAKENIQNIQQVENLNIQQAEDTAIRQSENLDIQQSEKLENRTPKRRKWKFRGFYLSPENEVKLKELELYYLRRGRRFDLSDIVNMAIEKLYGEIVGE